MDTIPRDVWGIIVNGLDIASYYAFCMTCKCFWGRIYHVKHNKCTTLKVAAKLGYAKIFMYLLPLHKIQLYIDDCKASKYSWLTIAAVESNNIEFIQNVYKITMRTCDMVKIASSHSNNIEFIQNVYKITMRTCDMVKIASRAIKYGYLKVLKWTIYRGYSITNITAYNAAKYNRINILEWLYNVDCNMDQVIEGACCWGNIDVLEWCLSKNINNFDDNHVNSAIVNSQLKSLKWLKAKGYWRIEFTELKAAAHQHRIDVFQFILEEYLINFDNVLDGINTIELTTACIESMSSDSVEVMKIIINTFNIRVTEDMIDLALSYNKLNMLIYLRSLCLINSWGAMILIDLVHRNCKEIVLYALDNGVMFNQQWISICRRQHHYELLKIFHERGYITQQ
jgi:hypothetical protein